jgi:hypothetical protein
LGYALDWVSVNGLEAEDVLSRLGIADTGEPTDWPEPDGFMWAVSPQGRIIVVAARFSWLGPRRLSGLSAGVEAVACSAESDECWAGAWGYRNGAQIWSVIHDQAGHDGDLSHMETEGEVPEVFAEIHARLLGDLAADVEPRTDHLFSAPQDLAALLGGWRPEGLDYDALEFFTAQVVSESADDWAQSYRRPAPAAAPSWRAFLAETLSPPMPLDKWLSLFGLVPALAGVLCGFYLLLIPLFSWGIEGWMSFLIGGVIVLFLALVAGAGILSFQGFSSQLVACAVSAFIVGPMLSMRSASPAWPFLAWGVVACGGLGLVGTLSMRLRRTPDQQPI